MMTVTNRRRNLLRWGIPGALVALVGLAALAIALVSGSVRASNGVPASKWHIGYYTTSPHGTISFAAAPSAPGGIASLDFTDQPNTALLTTDNQGQFPTLLGDLSGKSVSASFAISGVTSTFVYFGEPSCGNTTSTVRYYFQTSNAGGFDETHYWWSNPVAANLNGNGTVSLPAVSFTGASWSDYYGHYGNDPNYATGFNAAVSHVTEIGLSFGGGCFFENGVGTSDGMGTFTLNAYTVS